jgi:hypothetical protein
MNEWIEVIDYEGDAGELKKYCRSEKQKADKREGGGRAEQTREERLSDKFGSVSVGLRGDRACISIS